MGEGREGGGMGSIVIEGGNLRVGEYSFVVIVPAGQRMRGCDDF